MDELPHGVGWTYEGKETCELCNYTMDREWIKKVIIQNKVFYICGDCCVAVESAEYLDEEEKD